MFNYYDHNSDSNLDATELHDIEHRDHLSQLSRSCGLGDMLSRDDTSGDDAISLEEFYAAFSEYCLGGVYLLWWGGGAIGQIWNGEERAGLFST